MRTLLAPPPAPSDHDALAAVTRQTVAAIKKLTGHGPTEAHASWIDEDFGLLAVTLAGLYTSAEQSLIEAERFDLVRAGREAINRRLEPMLVAAVERTLGRTVGSLTIEFSESPPAGVVMFVLDDAGSARGEAA